MKYNYLICAKDFLLEKNIYPELTAEIIYLFQKDKKYKVKYVKDDTIRIYSEFGGGVDFTLTKHKERKLYRYVHDYFITEKELRKLKLEKLK